MNAGRGKRRFPPYAYVGILVIGLAEGLLFGGNQLVGHWFTPIVWTGYILFVDALVYKLKGRSLLMNDRLEFLAVAIIFPAMFETAELFTVTIFSRQSQRRSIKLSKTTLVVLAVFFLTIRRAP